MQSLNFILAQLLEKGSTQVATDNGKEYRITYSRLNGFFDLVVANGNEPMGFITIKDKGLGRYSIVNDTTINFHPSFINTPGHGIEVKKKYRKRGIGGWLICLAIGLIRRERQSLNKSKRFLVIASDITPDGLGCYKKFGFTIREGMSVSAAHFLGTRMVAEPTILSTKASFFTRLHLRLLAKKSP